MKLLLRILEAPILLIASIFLGLIMIFAFFIDFLTRPLSARNFLHYLVREDPAPNQD